MSLTTRTRLRTTVASALAIGLVTGWASTASATEEAAEDPRAERHDGNVTTCAEFGGGILISLGDDEAVENTPELVYEGGQPNQDRHLTITEVPDDLTVTAVVVKGGPAYNVYVPGENGLSATAPWEDLRAPLNPGGNVPTISHWFACGEEAPSPTSTPPESEPSEPEEPGESESEEPEPSTEQPSSSAETTPPPGETESTTATEDVTSTPETSETDVSPAGESDDLASTGFSGGWLIAVGAALLLGGGVLLALTRIRRSGS
ncbi:hypothetical protein [Saccharomonospora saliphila]|uniref:hypothetical protein n=1 Tax=Saccharomonospora saliphila TaxID=369829 RepID=UPI000377B598|nr:hypothetical protein [Saccharomonospora saliphila]